MKSKLLRLIPTLVLLLCVASCSKTGDILEKIPADANTVISIGLDNIIKSTGSTVSSNGTVTPSKELSSLGTMTDKNLMNLLTSSAVDREKVVIVEEIGESFFDINMVAIIKINNESELRSQLKNFPQIDLQIKDGFGYILIAGNDNYISSLQERAANRSITSIPWKAETLSKEHALTLVNDLSSSSALKDVLSSKMPAGAQGFIKKLLESTMVFSATLDNDKLKFFSKAYSSEGKDVEFSEYFTDVNPEFLQYLSPSAFVTGAAGFSSIFPWQGLATWMVNMANLRGSNKVMVLTVADYLQAIDGTLAFGVGLQGDDMTEPSSWDGMIYASMVDGKNISLANDIFTIAKTNFHLNCTTEGPNYFSIEGLMDDVKIYIKCPENKFIISMDPITGEGGSSFKESQFKNCCGAFYMNIPKNGQLASMLNLPYGIEINSKSDKSLRSEGEVTLTGSSKPFLQAIIGAIY